MESLVVANIHKPCQELCSSPGAIHVVPPWGFFRHLPLQINIKSAFFSLLFVFHGVRLSSSNLVLSLMPSLCCNIANGLWHFLWHLQLVLLLFVFYLHRDYQQAFGSKDIWWCFSGRLFPLGPLRVSNHSDNGACTYCIFLFSA